MKIKKISVTLSTFLLCCILIDFFLSWNYFNISPNRFILYEVNTEIVRFFANGEIPLQFILILVLGPLIIGIMSFFILKEVQKEKKENKHSHIPLCCAQWLFISGLIFVGFSRISAGLTWYHFSMAHVIRDTVLFLTFFSLVCSLCILIWLEIKKALIKRRAKVHYVDMEGI